MSIKTGQLPAQLLPQLPVFGLWEKSNQGNPLFDATRKCRC